MMGFLPFDTQTLEHNDFDTGYLRKRDGVPIGFLPTHPLRNDPDRSVFDDVPPRPSLEPWYMKDGNNG